MIDLAISFDATGSMSPCISEVKRKVKDLVNTLSRDIKGIRFAIIIHGDYCDRDVISELDFTSNPDKIYKFIDTRRDTGGGDSPECYELALSAAHSFSWSDNKRILLMIGDEVPHGKGYRYDSRYVACDYKDQLENLRVSDVTIYGVQCLNRRESNWFYQEISDINNGCRIELNQFHNIIELINAVSYKHVDRLDHYEEELSSKGLMNRNLIQMFEQISGKKSKRIVLSDKNLEAVHPARFQILHVDYNCVIKDFVEESGAEFKKGRGFYQFTKRETIQERKEVVLRDKKTGDLFTGDYARKLIGLPYGKRGDIRPVELEQYDVFVQSTSSNRKLLGDTLFLYETK